MRKKGSKVVGRYVLVYWRTSERSIRSSWGGSLGEHLCLYDEIKYTLD